MDSGIFRQCFGPTTAAVALAAWTRAEMWGGKDPSSILLVTQGPRLGSDPARAGSPHRRSGPIRAQALVGRRR